MSGPGDAAGVVPEAGGSGPRRGPWSGDGREELAAAVRRLAALCVTAVPDPGVLGDLSRRIAALADELEPTVPPPGSPRDRYGEGRAGPEAGGAGALAAAMPFDMIVGACNPVSPPLRLEFDPPVARGVVTFPPPFEGAPGCVHGAALAATFDIVLTAANVIAGAAGPTVELRLRYRKPTLIDRPARFEAEVVSSDRRRTHTAGRLLQDGVVTVEADGEFVSLAPERLEMLQRMASSRRSPTGAGERGDAASAPEPPRP